ncbi:unnamed protein product [Cylindrotheca closterium]|uniref:Lipid desaturase domain-containing protein n=1 Tax=Cylindrotheca closterium TaxID=2856 RepID=A0AAD2CEM9_9STRA|nr:unnamed protein product [Cylindrotheca closterium]
MSTLPHSSSYDVNSEMEDVTSGITSFDANELESRRRNFLDDGFVFGLEGSGLERPKGKVAQVVVEGDNLETEQWQVLFVCLTFLAHAAFASGAFTEILQRNSGNFAVSLVECSALLVSSWVLADLGSGILHWSVDNYGNGRTPIMGGVIAAFQGHHSAPWTITDRGFCNNVYKLCIPFGAGTVGLVSLLSGPFVTFFIVCFCIMEILSQEFHKWSHMTKSECPNIVNGLQTCGLLIARQPHAQHHMAPYDGNYCIISGLWNQLLDDSGFFRRLEHIIYNVNGIESNAWKLDEELKQRTLQGKYNLSH